jgi:hypothetical protein
MDPCDTGIVLCLVSGGEHHYTGDKTMELNTAHMHK